MMSEKPRQYSPGEINSIFAGLDPQDVERFYQSYQLWTLQQQIAGLQTQIASLQQQIAENNERMQQAHPSAIALATLARLQSYGITDIDLLDRMLERGEAWLDRTMQRLAYCEQSDFIRNNYTEWCEHALDGAYDWIDSMLNASSSPEESSLAATSTTSAANTNSTLDEATEEILLQKLMSDEEAFMLEPTLKRPAVSPAQPEEIAAPVEYTIEPEQAEHILAPEEVIPLEMSDTSDTAHATAEQVTLSEQIEIGPVQPESEESPLAAVENILPAGEAYPIEVADRPELSQVFVEQTPALEHAEHLPAAGEFVPAEDAATSDSSHIPAEQAVEVAHDQDTPSAGEFVPAEVDDAHEASHNTVEPAAPSEQVEVELVSPESEESPLAHNKDSLPALEVPLPISNNTSSRGEKPLPSETNGFSGQAANQVSTQRSSQQHLRVTKPRRKRGFLRRLIAVLFRW